MPPCLDTIGMTVNNPSTTVTAFTPSNGDSFTIRNGSPSSSIEIVSAFRQGVTAGIFRFRSPKMHDNVEGVSLRALAADPSPLLPIGSTQTVYAQDTLIVEGTGEASGNDTAALVVYYSDLPGQQAQFVSWEQIASTYLNLVGVRVAPTSSATIGTWAGAAVNSTVDLLHANTNYAVLGYETDTAVAALAVRGPDLGNLRAGGPGTTTRIETRGWFRDLSQRLGIPCIPVFNSANKAGTFVDVIAATASVAPNVNLILAQLP